MERTRSDIVLILDQGNTKTRSMDNIELKDQVAGEEKPRNPTARAQSLRRLSFSKPKARLIEYNYTNAQKTIPESDDAETLLETQPYSTLSDGEDYDDENAWNDEVDEEDERMGTDYKKKKRKFQLRLFVEWVMFLIIMTCLICSLTVNSIKNKQAWGHEIWKWCLMVMVTFCGRLVSGWVMGFVVFLIERNFMLREKVLYFVYGLRKSIQNCIWLALVLVAWMLMFNKSDARKRHELIVQKVFQGLVAILLDATIWLIKIVLVKVLASSFHVATYFDRMKESVFHHYILDTLSGPPLMEDHQNAYDKEQHVHNLTGSKTLPPKWKQSGWKEARNGFKSEKFGSRKIDMEKLRKLSTERTGSAWNVKRLVNYVMSSGLSTISNTVDDFGKAESEITSEWEARNTAKRVFRNVAKPGANYIEEEDLTRFLKRVEIHTIFPLFEGALETGRISKSAFRNWVVRAYYERKALAHSLNDTKTAVQQLHKIASAMVMVIIVVVTLLVMGFASLKVIFLVSTQLVVVGVIFQNMCKTVFESIIFVFVMHPFDIGDRCVVDGVHMIVEEMNILTTVFLRYDMEKIYYPNSTLLTKPISNFYRSPEMSDCINFTIDVSTTMETIVALKKAIQGYIESKPNYWNPKHSVTAKDIEQANYLNLCLCVQHTINHQNYGERCNRISELILELKKMFENLGIKYRLLPQEINLTHTNFDAWMMPSVSSRSNQ
ncbi:hypothetical protein K2173_002779 [Erythroxylum novogranatense]|uniref:Mechanosensitive ion channel protein n=1 Tax=Erythroxylum novogranatense TaxID=1862640 RepID=A0AAV8SQI5_9ROSI|nr:hypothetical protein K2173_002779 [Erythroxylum novogranatense]